jgi:hypothetical protein
MPHNSDLLALAHAVLRKHRDSARDSRGTAPKDLSQGTARRGTAELPTKQSDNPTVPPSKALGFGTMGHPENPGTAHGTVTGHPYDSMLPALRSKCPELVEPERWLQAISDAEAFLAAGDRATFGRPMTGAGVLRTGKW